MNQILVDQTCELLSYCATTQYYYQRAVLAIYPLSPDQIIS